MTETESPLQRSLKLALALFPAGPSQAEDIERNCDDVLSMLQHRNEALPDRDLLIKEVQSRVIVWQPGATSLEDTSGHDEWLDAARTNIEWAYWDRYRRYLEQVELLPPAVISRLDESTDRVLEKLENPSRRGPWDRRGMVVGHVQSGKTSHYTALACKAADVGYKLIVILTGTHDSLRSQTQLRLDQGLLGFDTQYHQRSPEDRHSRIGVGALQGAEAPKIGSLTTSLGDGDFTKGRAQGNTVPIGDMPILLVIKKNGSILDNLLEWVIKLHGVQLSQNSQEKVVPDVPLLLIDDEADNASINTSKPDEDPTKINQKIRKLLLTFTKSAYVGYTATPFANIYSSVDTVDKFGADLFPRHFIESLKAPSNYFGPTRVFGLDATEDAVARLPLPIFRKVDDYSKWMPDRHKSSWKPNAEDFPATLKKAMLSFILVCAARRVRKQETKHNSMLIHTTRFQLVQGEVREQVEDYLRLIRYRLRYGDGASDSVWEDLQHLWINDFETTSANWDNTIEIISWELLRPHIRQAADKIEVRTINGQSQDALEYYNARKMGLSVIAIGGDKLSRGLTLEGLSISYYLRASRMYDTLMQMGRWFGYRPGYEDLCRLYTTTQLRNWYREITSASEELRADFDDLANRAGAASTPEMYGLRVRQSSAGLSVTAPSKMRSATTVTMTFSGDLSESVTFQTDDAAVTSNLHALTQLITSLRSDSKIAYTPANQNNTKGGNHVWSMVPGDSIAHFFDAYVAAPEAVRAKPRLLAGYIRAGIERGELIEWTVVLVTSSSSKATRYQVADLDIGLTIRRPLDNIAEIRSSKRYRIRRVLSPSDESLDLGRAQRDDAIAQLRLELEAKERLTGRQFKEPEYPRGASLRRQRSPASGLLLIYPLDNRIEDTKEFLASEPLVGFAASFPFSATNLTAQYRVNDVWFKQMLNQMPDEGDDDE